MLSFALCLSNLLNNDVRYTIHFMDNFLRTRLNEIKITRFVVSMVFCLLTLFLTINWGFPPLLFGVCLIVPNVFVGIPLFVHLKVIPEQSVGKVLLLSSVIAIFIFFSLTSLIILIS